MSLFDSASKGLKFDQIGVSHTGVVKSAPRERQQTKYNSQEPDFWPNGDPKMQILVDVQTDQRTEANDDGVRTLYVASKNMRRAISDAIRAAGAQDILPGGTLTVQYVGNDPASKNPQNPAKIYAAQYTPPASGFVQQAPAPVPQPAAVPSTPQPVQQMQPQAAPQPQFVPQAQPQQPFAQAAPAVPAHGLTDDQVSKLQQLRAAAIDDTTIATAIGATPQQITAFDNTPF